MPTEILSIGATDVTSADVIVTAGTPLTVALKGASGPNVPVGSSVDILLKSDAGTYFYIDTLTNINPATMIVAPGTYRFNRKAKGACGVFSG